VSYQHLPLDNMQVKLTYRSDAAPNRAGQAQREEQHEQEHNMDVDLALDSRALDRRGSGVAITSMKSKKLDRRNREKGRLDIPHKLCFMASENDEAIAPRRVAQPVSAFCSRLSDPHWRVRRVAMKTLAVIANHGQCLLRRYVKCL